ncbi:hypothetical protein GCM10011578_053450 [Streptomyces fuscichromogenes]|uniref:Uncharacterized protein n=1 Tax=Streptomyces fuscichromogenes TaxID=1324013 RepID=A0A917XG88_9ACTN|nr:hypothetical protein GCM10011578_053450 [Streptomyces fuscichromogenes]
MLVAVDVRGGPTMADGCGSWKVPLWSIANRASVRGPGGAGAELRCAEPFSLFTGLRLATCAVGDCAGGATPNPVVHFK